MKRAREEDSAANTSSPPRSPQRRKKIEVSHGVLCPSCGRRGGEPFMLTSAFTTLLVQVQFTGQRMLWRSRVAWAPEQVPPPIQAGSLEDCGSLAAAATLGCSGGGSGGSSGHGGTGRVGSKNGPPSPSPCPARGYSSGAGPTAASASGSGFLPCDTESFQCAFSACQFDCQKRAPVRAPCRCHRAICRKCATVAGAQPGGCGLCSEQGVEFDVAGCKADPGIMLALSLKVNNSV